jgi:hypothetical protein
MHILMELIVNLYIHMNETMRLLENFGMKCISELYVLQMTYRLCMRLIS